MNSNLNALLARLETTEILPASGTLRTLDSEGNVCMCPLGHLVDIWIQNHDGAHWVHPDDSASGHFRASNDNLTEGFPSDEMLAEFGLTYTDACKIYGRNDNLGETPAEVAAFIRNRLVR